MPRFFLSPDSFGTETVVLTGGDAAHISLSLRMAVGDSVTLCDGCGNDYFGQICAMTRESVSVRIVRRECSGSEPPYRAVLYQALAKGEKMELIVQKAVELGVHEIVPVVSERCIVKLDEQSATKKIARWQKIADEAAGQCGRGILPKVSAPLTFAKAVKQMAEHQVAFVCYEGDGTRPLCDIIGEKSDDFAFFVGPEGGVAPSEVELAIKAGIVLAGLGKRILRAETAPMYVLSAISYAHEL